MGPRERSHDVVEAPVRLSRPSRAIGRRSSAPLESLERAVRGSARAHSRRTLAEPPTGEHRPPRPPLDPQERDRRARERRRRRARILRNRTVVGGVVSLVIGLSLFAGLDGGGGPLSTPTSASSVKLPAPRLTSLVGTELTVPGPAPVLAWPVHGDAAVGVAGIGELSHSPRQRVVPIASLTKMMTAYVVLQDHPLTPGSPGPELKMTRWDWADWVHASQNDDSNVQVRAGEVLSEYQLLEALLLPSADNIADVLAIWDSASEAAFVAKMNATARRLGLDATHYADDSGVDPGSRSDAIDQVKLASLLMANPVVRQIVDQPRVHFPLAGTIVAVNPALGVDGIIGVKSGFTQAAGGCLATAAYRVVDGQRALVVAVTLGQPWGLYSAATVDERLITRAETALVPVHVSTPSEPVATISLAWSSAHLSALAPSTPETVVGWPQLVLDERLVAVSGATLAATAPDSPTSSSAPTSSSQASNTSTAASASASSRSDTRQLSVVGAPEVGTLEVSAPAGLVAAVPLVASRPIPAVPAGWAPPTS